VTETPSPILLMISRSIKGSSLALDSINHQQPSAVISSAQCIPALSSSVSLALPVLRHSTFPLAWVALSLCLLPV
jgi:hypothetical protein